MDVNFRKAKNRKQKKQIPKTLPIVFERSEKH